MIQVDLNACDARLVTLTANVLYTIAIVIVPNTVAHADRGDDAHVKCQVCAEGWNGVGERSQP